MKIIFIAGAARTTIGKFEGSLGSVSVTEFGTVVVREAMKRMGTDANDVEEAKQSTNAQLWNPLSMDS